MDTSELIGNTGGFKLQVAPNVIPNNGRKADAQNPLVTSPVGGGWPRVAELKLGQCELACRRATIGGSDANVILSGNGEKITRLWLEKRGLVEPQDFSAVLPVMLGCWTEEFNRQWYAQVTEFEIGRVGAVEVSVQHPWRRCTLDGFVEPLGAVFEAKHVNGFVKPDELLERYMPQLQHNMAVVGVDRALLSVIYGNHKWEVYEVASDWLYQDELFQAELAFRNCVISGREPVPAPIPFVPKPIGFREMCLEGNNAWAAAAADWLTNREPAKVHAAATALLKSLVENDVSRAFGHGVEAKRNKAGALSLRETRS